MRIIIYTDSLGRPRPDLDKDATNYSEIYASLLRNKLKGIAEIELLTNDGTDTDASIYLSKVCIAFREPDIVIYHLGVNDCAPRVFKKGSKPWIYSKYWFKKITFNIGAKIVTKYRNKLTKWRNFTYVKPEKFKSNFQVMMDEVKLYSPNAKFIGVSISESYEWMDKKSYGHMRNVKQYNSILNDVFKGGFIDVNKLVPGVEERLIHDGVHFTKHTHQVLAEELYKHVSEILKL